VIIDEISVFDENFSYKENKKIKIESPLDILKLHIVLNNKDNSIIEGDECLSEGCVSEIEIEEYYYDVQYIFEDELILFFVYTSLFIGEEDEFIIENAGISVEGINLLKKYIFNISIFRGKIAKISFFKRLMYSDNTKKSVLGQILKATHMFGKEYLKWKFALNTSDSSSENIVVTTFKNMYYKYIEESYSVSDNNKDSHIRTGKQLISAAVDVQRALSTNSGGNVLIELKNYMTNLNDSLSNDKTDWEAEMEIVDIEVENSKINDKGE